MRRWRYKSTKGRYRGISTCKFVVDIGVAFCFNVDFPRVAMAVGFGMRHEHGRAIWVINARSVDERLVEYVIILLLRVIVSGWCNMASRI